MHSVQLVCSPVRALEIGCPILCIRPDLSRRLLYLAEDALSDKSEESGQIPCYVETLIELTISQHFGCYRYWDDCVYADEWKFWKEGFQVTSLVF